MTCQHAANGCNYPEGECFGVCMNRVQTQRLTIVYEVHSIGHREALLHSTSSLIASSDGDAIQQRDKLAASLRKAVERQGFTNDELIEARAIIQKATGSQS